MEDVRHEPAEHSSESLIKTAVETALASYQEQMMHAFKETLTRVADRQNQKLVDSLDDFAARLDALETKLQPGRQKPMASKPQLPYPNHTLVPHIRISMAAADQPVASKLPPATILSYGSRGRGGNGKTGTQQPQPANVPIDLTAEEPLAETKESTPLDDTNSDTNDPPVTSSQARAMVDEEQRGRFYQSPGYSSAVLPGIQTILAADGDPSNYQLQLPRVDFNPTNSRPTNASKDISAWVLRNYASKEKRMKGPSDEGSNVLRKRSKSRPRSGESEDDPIDVTGVNPIDVTRVDENAELADSNVPHIRRGEPVRKALDVLKITKKKNIDRRFRVYFELEQDDGTYIPKTETVNMNTLDRWDKKSLGFWACVEEYYEDHPDVKKDTMVPRIPERLKALAEQRKESRRSRQRAYTISSGGSMDEDDGEDDDSNYEESSSDDDEPGPADGQEDASNSDPMPHDGRGRPDDEPGPIDDQGVASSSNSMPPIGHINRMVFHPLSAFTFNVPRTAGESEPSTAPPQQSVKKAARGPAKPSSHPNTSQTAAAQQGHLHFEASQGLSQQLESTQDVFMPDIPTVFNVQAPSQPEHVSTPSPVQEHTFPAPAPEQSGKDSVPAAESGHIFGKTSSLSSMFPSRSQ